MNSSPVTHRITPGSGKVREPDADGSRQQMIGNRGRENAGDDRPGPAQPRGKHEGEQLRLVADFCDGDQQVEVRKASMGICAGSGAFGR